MGEGSAARPEFAARAGVAARPLARGGRWAGWVFPVLLWFVASFFLFGDLGLWNDDWFYVQRIPETGAVRALVLDREVHFWRPLYRVIVPSLATLLWEHQQVNHFIGAGAHGAVAVMLWLLLRRLGVRRLACGLGAMVFVVFPWHTEVVFWLCNLPTSLSAAVMLWAMHLAVSWARGRGGWWVVGAAGALTFAACCLNEQPAMLFGALPLAYACGVPGAVGKRALVRGASLAGAGAASVGVYWVMHARHSASAMDIGAGHGVLPLAEWPLSAAEMWRWAGAYIWSMPWFGRALECGIAAMGSHPIRATLLLAPAALGAVAWVISMSRDGHRVHASRGGATTVPTSRVIREGAKVRWLALLGVAMIVCTAAPVVAFRYWLMPRVLYPPALGLAVLLAAAMTFATNRSPRPVETLGTARMVVAATGAVILGVLALAMVGVQDGFQRRGRMDREALARVRTLMPSPALESVLVPARVDPPEATRRAKRFEYYYWNVFSSWWSSQWAIQLEYRRTDLGAAYTTWGGTAWRSPAHDGVYVEGTGRVPWGRVVPFEVDAQNRVRLITGVRFVNVQGQAREVRVPQTWALVERGEVEEKWFVFEGGSPGPH